jgi:hypothetical protein
MTKKKNTKDSAYNLNLENLLLHFKEKAPSAVIQEETNQILITIKVEKVEFPLFLRISEDGELLQMLAFFPANIKPGSQADTARALHLLNKELDVPGFGMDDLNGLIFYRYMLPCLGNEFNPVAVDKFFNAIQMICQSFLPLIFAISQGNLKFEEIANKLTEMMQQT